MITDILVILDRSGSMQTGREDHEGGLRSFVEDQRQLDGDVRFTMIQFDTSNPCEVVYDRVPLADVGEIKLIPRGGTPLLAAIGLATAHLEAKQIKEPAEQTVAIVITDGGENDSHVISKEWTKDRIKKLVATMETEERAWKFLFLGADMDAFGEASNAGISAASTVAFTNTVGASVNAVYTATAQNVTRMRAATATGAGYAQRSACMNYSDEQRDDILKKTEPDIFGDLKNTVVVPTSVASGGGSGATVVTTDVTTSDPVKQTTTAGK